MHSADADTDARVADAGTMPAGGEFRALSDPSYGHLNAAPNAPRPGDEAPDFELPTHTGGSSRLSEELAEGPVVLMFYRGFW